MAIDTQEKRMSVVGVGRPWMRSKLPSAGKGIAWRQSSGNIYSGNSVIPDAATTTIVLRPDKDCYISDGSTTTVFNGDDLIVQGASPGDLIRALVRYDLTDIPSSATISAATLTWEVTAITGTPSATIARLVRVFEETESTWTIAETGTNWTTAGAGHDGDDYTTTDQVTGWIMSVSSDESPSILTLVDDAITSRSGSLNLRVAVAVASGQSATIDSRRMLVPASRVPPILNVSYTIPVGTAVYDGAATHIRSSGVSVGSLDGVVGELDLFFRWGATPATPFTIDTTKNIQLFIGTGNETAGNWNAGIVTSGTDRVFELFESDAPVVVSGEIMRWRVRLKEKIPASIWNNLRITIPAGAFTDDNSIASPAATVAGFQNLCDLDYTETFWAESLPAGGTGSRIDPDGRTFYTGWDFGRVALIPNASGHSQTDTPIFTADPGGKDERIIGTTFISVAQLLDVVDFKWSLATKLFEGEEFELTIDGLDITISTSTGDINPDSARKANRHQMYNNSTQAGGSGGYFAASYFGLVTPPMG